MGFKLIHSQCLNWEFISALQNGGGSSWVGQECLWSMRPWMKIKRARTLFLPQSLPGKTSKWALIIGCDAR